MTKYQIEFEFEEIQRKNGLITVEADDRKEAVDKVIFKVDYHHLKAEPKVTVIGQNDPRPKFIAVSKVTKVGDF